VVLENLAFASHSSATCLIYICKFIKIFFAYFSLERMTTQARDIERKLNESFLKSEHDLKLVKQKHEEECQNLKRVSEEREKHLQDHITELYRKHDNMEKQYKAYIQAKDRSIEELNADKQKLIKERDDMRDR